MTTVDVSDVYRLNFLATRRSDKEKISHPLNTKHSHCEKKNKVTVREVS